MAWAVGLVAVTVLAVAAWRSWPHLRFRYLFEPLGKNVQGYPEYRHRQSGIVFVRLPGGTFRMGSPETEEGREADEGPVHEVTLSPFLIAKYEVTQAAWKRVMGSNPSGFKGDDLPVERVSWDDCQEFCRKTGLKLPSEAQWEYACRAGVDGPFSGTGRLADIAWYDKNSGETTHPVGKKTANGFGLHDLHGNVWEWCEDVYDEEFYARAAASRKDPVCRSGSGLRVPRGGSWYDSARYCRSALRGWNEPADRYLNLGFRPAFFPLP